MSIISPYAPYIKSVLPSAEIGGTITIPYQMNPAVGYSEVFGFQLKLTPYGEGGESITLSAYSYSPYEADFRILEEELLVAGAYQAQLNYVFSGGTSAFSSLGIIKLVNELPYVFLDEADSYGDYFALGYTQQTDEALKDVTFQLLEDGEVVYEETKEITANMFYNNDEHENGDLEGYIYIEPNYNFKKGEYEVYEESKKDWIYINTHSLESFVDGELIDTGLTNKPCVRISQSTSTSGNVPEDVEVSKENDAVVLWIRPENNITNFYCRDTLGGGSFSAEKASLIGGKWNKVYGYFDDDTYGYNLSLIIGYNGEGYIDIDGGYIVQRGEEDYSEPIIVSTSPRYQIDLTYTTVTGFVGESLNNFEYREPGNTTNDILVNIENDFEHGYNYINLSLNLGVSYNDYWCSIYRKNKYNPAERICIGVLHITPDYQEDYLIDYYTQQYDEYKYEIFIDIFQAEEEIYHIGSYLNKTDWVVCDFENTLLDDINYQLVLSFNTQISDFKKNSQTTMVTTIGNKYPTFYKNNIVDYVEMPISGTISYWMDKDEYFTSKEELGLDSGDDTRISTRATEVDNLRVPTTAYKGYNYAAERRFKMKVYEWLNNGQPKLLRTPQEGNFIVILHDISLQPFEGTDRMIHSFSGTMTEIAPATVKNIRKYIEGEEH